MVCAWEWKEWHLIWFGVDWNDWYMVTSCMARVGFNLTAVSSAC